MPQQVGDYECITDGDSSFFDEAALEHWCFGLDVLGTERAIDSCFFNQQIEQIFV
jgi:hypothetical protein